MIAWRPRSLVVVLGLGGAVSTACAHEAGGNEAQSGHAIHASGAGASADPTVRGPRIVPETIDDLQRTFGIEPGGGLRSIAGGTRIVSLPNGAVLAADDRLPGAPTFTIALPERLGGGFLFVLGTTTVWRADRWLAPARPIFTSALAIARVIVGLDRIYLRATNGAHQAIDARTGALLDLGPWPGSSFVGGYAAVDGWRAVAIDDLRGVVATFDAGATWRTLAMPIDAREVQAIGDAIAVSGFDASRAMTSFEVRGDGQVGRLANGSFPALSMVPSPPGSPFGAWPPPLARDAAASDARDLHPVVPLDAAAKPFGRRPLVAAVEDGWPLADGTAVVARDGVLARIRLGDGALVESVPDAYPLKPSRCHPVPFAQGIEGGFGFICGEPRGATAIYAYDAPNGRMIETKRFDAPRLVLSSGNGAIAVRGPCAASGSDDDSNRVYCTRSTDTLWRDVPIGPQSGGERVVVLADGSFIIVSPPRGDLASAHLTIRAGSSVRSVPIHFPELKDDLSRVLNLGVWLDGFEERRPGVLGGWIEAGGSMLGIEITLEGQLRIGEFIRDAGWPMVSGRYGLGWTASRRGYETIDGGMTWAPIDVPEPIGHKATTSRACGPIGCTASGWLRVGWGPLPSAKPYAPPVFARPPFYGAYSALTLTCESTSPVAKPVTARAVIGGSVRSTEPLLRGITPPPSQPLPAFYTYPPPDLRSDERGVSYEANELLGRHGSLGPLGRAYGWGPRSGEWEHSSKWLVRWLWPYGGPSESHVSQSGAAPPIVIEAARFGAAAGAVMMTPTWAVAPGDDAAHVLFIGRRSARADAVVYEAEADRPPFEVKRADGDPFTEIDAAIRAGGRWYIATPPAQGELMTSIVWQVDGAIARELARIPRAGMDGRPIGAHLARRSDGRAVGLVVDGQPSPARPGALRWVLPIDLDTGALGEPESLGASDLGDRTSIPLCTGDFEGWILDTTFSVPTTIRSATQSIGILSGGSTLARVRVAPTSACVERLAGAFAESYVADHLSTLGPASIHEGEASISVSLFAGHTHHPLRCVVR